MRIRAGYELVYECPQPTSMVLALSIHPSRRVDLLTDQVLEFSPELQARDYVDGFGNICTRILAPAGATRVSTLFDIEEAVCPTRSRRMPASTTSRTCHPMCWSTSWAADTAIPTASQTLPGRSSGIPSRAGDGCSRLSTSCTTTSPSTIRTPTRCTAYGGFLDRTGVCRDFAHLAIALCRCMNIPARYCTGYLGDIGVPPCPTRWTSAPGSRSGWTAAGIRSTPATTARALARS